MRKTLAGLALILAGCSSTYQEAPRRTLDDAPVVAPITPADAPKTPTIETKPVEPAQPEYVQTEITYKMTGAVSGLVEGYFQKHGMTDEIKRIEQLANFDVDRDGSVSTDEISERVEFAPGPAQITYTAKIPVVPEAKEYLTSLLEKASPYEKLTFLKAADKPLTEKSINDVLSDLDK